MAKSGYYHGEAYCRWDVANLNEGLLNFAWASRGKLLKYMEEEAAPMLEEYMKANRPWQDQTNKAKEGLTAEVYSYGSYTDEDFSVGIQVYHTAYNDRGERYGEYLESGTSHAKAYPILEPTVRKKGPDVVQNMRGLLERVGFYE